MDYAIFSSNGSILQSSAIHPIIATADKSGHFVPVGVTSAFVHAKYVCQFNTTNAYYLPNISFHKLNETSKA